MNGQMKEMKSHPIRYLYGLDGLRAIAVIAIIIYHLNPKWLSGGFLGVDTFFIISGYLITSLLIHEYQQTGTIDLLHFWKKRIKRLLPAVLFLLSIVLIYTLLFEPSIIKNVKQDTFAALFYVSNWWYIFHHVSYFDSFKVMPLKHLWSLAIEEQFYVFWPILLMLLLRIKKLKRHFVLVVFISSLISLLLMILIAEPNVDNSRVYFGTDTRLQTLLLGVLLAYIWPPFRLKQQIITPLKIGIETIGCISIALLIYFMLTVSSNDNWLYFGGIYLISLSSLPAIASAVHPSTLLSKALGNRLFLWIGKRSYSLYLWHYPVITFINKYFVQGQIPFYMILIEIILTLLLAECSYRYVEVPIRVRGLAYFKPVKTQLKSLIAKSSITLVLVGLTLTILSGHFDYLQQAQHHHTKTTFKVSNHDHKNSLILPIPKINVNSEQTINHKGKHQDKMLFIGDSVMVDIGEEIHKAYPDAIIDGKVGRNLNDAIPLVQEKYSTYNKPNQQVVLELGTNGDFSYDDLTKLIKMFVNAHVYVVNIHVPRDWEQSVNDKLLKAADSHKNVQLVNWYQKAKDHSEYFAYDGVHLEYKGVQALVSEINKHVKS
ncbi:acyltransferase family protein [Mammaliicoccus sciuri]|uniref:acyltransferase family protein n=1 Tax=Mammaliicoccus sciuri TaxID=1296 RepID=UPI0018DBD438|nr:acyltransferase family protein [Mammaliicoccus sciuri]QPW12728.1 acetyltransferase [Mammaliicoccus sciuri]